jgi:ABC-type transporter Mla MlaB component
MTKVASSAVDAFMKTLKRKRGTAVEATASVLALPSTCTVKDAAELKDLLCGQLESSDCVVLDVANVERIDTAALQLLCAFVRDRQARGGAVQWQGNSAAFQEASDLLAVRDLLGLGAAPAGAAS